MSKHRLVVVFSSLLVLGLVSSVTAHEPIFGIGPHTIYKNGLGLESELEMEEQRMVINYEVLYGITPDMAVTLVAPWVRRTGEDIARTGWGDLALRAKWRFLRRDGPGRQDQLALVVGVKLPTGDEGGSLPLGSGSTDLFGGLTGGRESRRWYYFGDLRYRLNRAANHLERGDVLSYDVAWGVRPWRIPYEKPDLVLLLEANGKVAGKTRYNGVRNPNTGGHILALSPAFLLSYRNIMLKGGINVPLWWDLNGIQEDPGVQMVVGIEFHV